MSKSRFKKLNDAEVRKALGRRIKNLRIENSGLSAEALANKAGLSRTLYSNYEAGKVNMSLKNLVKILNGLEVPIDEFFGTGF